MISDSANGQPFKLLGINVGKWLVNPPLNSWGVVNKLFQLIMKRFFMCDWFFIAKCIGHYVLDFVLANVLLAGWAGCLLLLLSFSFSFFISSHFISFHPRIWISKGIYRYTDSQKDCPKKVGPLYSLPPLLITWGSELTFFTTPLLIASGHY